MVLIQNNDSYDTYSWWYSYPKYIWGCPAGMVLIEADYTGTDENMPGLTSSQTGSPISVSLYDDTRPQWVNETNDHIYLAEQTRITKDKPITVA